MCKSHIALAVACVVAGIALETLRTRKAPRAHNFSAGPGPLDNEVLAQAQSELWSLDNTGMSIMEMSHRDAGGGVQTMMTEAEANVRTLLNVPSSYSVLFMHGGAHAQFAAIPLNLNASRALYANTGYWSQRARKEAEKIIGADAVDEFDAVTVDPATGERSIKAVAEWPEDASSNYSYLYFCASETIDGIAFLSEENAFPKGVPIVADFTSTLLSRPVDISKYAVIFASGGKNLGPSGMTLVIVAKEYTVAAQASRTTPSIMSYHLAATSLPIPSIYSTPPTFNIYMHGLVLKKLKKMGGMAAIEERAKRRASLIYDVIDHSHGFYVNSVHSSCRSRMSVPMRIGGETAATARRDLEERFAREAAAAGLLQLFGHPVKGGLRVTLYNGVRDESVALVADFMRVYARANSFSTVP